MPTPTALLSGLIQPIKLCVLPADNKVVIAFKDGKITTVDLAAPALVPVGIVPGPINGMDLTADGPAYGCRQSTSVQPVFQSTGGKRCSRILVSF